MACAEAQLCVDAVEDAAEASPNIVTSDPVGELNPLHVPANMCDVFTKLANESSANNKETLGESSCESVACATPRVRILVYSRVCTFYP